VTPAPAVPPAKGGRLALFCETCHRREFGDPTWRCPEHPSKTVVQANRPYFSIPHETPSVKGLKTVDPALQKPSG